MSRQTILDLSTKALGPAGIIILVTGAGGVLKQILVDSGIGKMLAESLAGSSIPILVLAWVLAALVRITQGSATVAMITAAGIMAPILPAFNLDQANMALIVICNCCRSHNTFTCQRQRILDCKQVSWNE